jgi:uncharacterized protein (UPF0147 family)
VWIGVLGASTIGGLGWLAVGCGWNPRQPFMRNAPEVDRAIGHMDAGDYESAQKVLSDYLGTGVCSEDGGIALSDKVRKRPDGSFDLGLVLFHLAEKYGGRFGDEEQPGPDGGEPTIDPKRSAEIDCALIVVQAIFSDQDVPMDLRARAAYLAGNLEFLRRKYQDAVKYYDTAIGMIPGIAADARGDAIGRDAAWNRAIALRRIEDKDKDAEPPDAQPDAEPDAQPDAQPDAGDDGGQGDKPDGGDGDKDGGDKGGDDAGPDAGNEQPDGGKEDPKDGDKNKDGQNKDSPESMAPPPESSREPPSSRMLDDLREVPSYQEENAKRDAVRGRRGQATEDK